MGQGGSGGADCRWGETTCGFCAVGCGMEIGVRDGRAVAVRGIDAHPVSGGRLCANGLRLPAALAAPGRAVRPLARRGGALGEVGWPEAARLLVERIRRVQAVHGAGAVAVLGTGRLLTEEQYALGKLVRVGLGVRHYDDTLALSGTASAAGYRAAFGSEAPPGSYDDLDAADLILLVGANPAENQPVLHDRMIRNAGATIVVVDPRTTRTAAAAHVHLAVRPGTDLALLNGVCHLLIAEERFDKAFVERRTSGFARLRAAVAADRPGTVAAVTGLDERAVRELAGRVASARAMVMVWGMGVNHSVSGSATIAGITNLALLTGHVGRPGAGPLALPGQANTFGAAAGAAAWLPGYRRFDAAEDREDLARAWHVPLARVPAQRGLAYPEIIEAVLARDIRALWVIGGDPLTTHPNGRVLTRAFERLEFLAVQNTEHPTATSALADLVLPAAHWGEKEGTTVNAERRLGGARRVVAPPGEARSDFDIVLEVARAAGCARELFPSWTSPADAFREWVHLSPGLASGAPGHGLDGVVGIAGTALRPVGRLYGDGRFATADGLARLQPVVWEPFPEPPNPEYPFVLNTGRAARPAGLSGAWIDMHPSDARRLRLKVGDAVHVLSRRGRVGPLSLRPTGTVPPGQVFVPVHVPGAAVNALTQSLFDPRSRAPNYKQCAVRVERAGARKAWWRRRDRSGG